MKESRTIVVMKEQTIDDNDIVNKSNLVKTKSGSVFIEFDDVKDSIKTFENLNAKNIKCKYSYYNIFFRTSKNLENSDINEQKKEFSENIESKYENSKILEIIFYKRKENFIGTGYLVVDKIDNFNNLINSKMDFNEKESINFYRFNKN